MTPGLRCRQLTFERRTAAAPPAAILQNIDADFPQGAITLIQGPTGAGKSTLLHLLAGLLRPGAGTVWAHDDPVSRWHGAHLSRWRRKVGLIFQHDCLVPGLTVLENVYLPLLPRGGRLADLQDRALQALQQVDLAACAGLPAVALSGGERQRAAAARALVVHPAYLLADEPLAHQDAVHGIALASLLAHAAASGATVVVAQHTGAKDFAAWPHQRLHLHQGRLTEAP
jgi:putative ABC transport system ATP-binding protein